MRPEIDDRLSSRPATLAVKLCHMASSSIGCRQAATMAEMCGRSPSSAPSSDQMAANDGLCRRSRPSDPNTATPSLRWSSVSPCTLTRAL